MRESQENGLTHQMTKALTLEYFERRKERGDGGSGMDCKREEDNSQ